MTNFTGRAVIEAERRHQAGETSTWGDPRSAFIAGAEWAASQEPTDAEVEAAAIEAYAVEREDIDPGWPSWNDAEPLSKDSTRAMVRAIFRAAREVR